MVGVVVVGESDVVGFVVGNRDYGCVRMGIDLVDDYFYDIVVFENILEMSGRVVGVRCVVNMGCFDYYEEVFFFVVCSLMKSVESYFSYFR